MLKYIVHVVTRDKFTSEYVNFIKEYFNQYNHSFLIMNQGYNELNFIDNDGVCFFNGFQNLFDAEFMSKFENADAIIIGGVFGIELYLNFFPKRLKNKMYLQFWGGDLYQFKENTNTLNIWVMKKIRYIFMRSLICSSKKVCVLIDEDYDELLKIFRLKNKEHVTLPVPSYNLTKIPNDIINIAQNVQNSTKKILVGNSADPTNEGIEILEKLRSIKDFDIKIFCPLSYGGDGKYEQIVINKGKSIFGDKFIPLTDYMDIQEYYMLLAQCDIAIFNHKRQQALGNIYALLKLGKKVYIRDDISTWKYLNRLGAVIYDTKIIDKLSFHQLFDYTKTEMENNYRIDVYLRNNEKKLWELFLEEIYKD